MTVSFIIDILLPGKSVALEGIAEVIDFDLATAAARGDVKPKEDESQPTERNEHGATPDLHCDIGVGPLLKIPPMFRRVRVTG